MLHFDFLAANAALVVEQPWLRVMDLFRDFDADGSGQIDKKEWKQAWARVGPDFPAEAVDEVGRALELELLFARGLPRMTYSYMRYPVMAVHATR